MEIIYQGCMPRDYYVSVSRKPKDSVEVHIHVPDNAKGVDDFILGMSDHHGLTEEEKNEVFMFVRQQIMNDVIRLPDMVDIS